MIKVDGQNFLIYKKDDIVVAFSQYRIPLEKSVKTSLFKKQLLTAITEIRTPNDELLVGRYGTLNASRSFFDLENVLFYNIGASVFNKKCERGISFSALSIEEMQRLREEYAVPSNFTHIYEYSLKAKERCVSLNGKAIVEWEAIPFCNLKGAKPADCWKCLRENEDLMHIGQAIDCEKSDRFIVCLCVEKPASSALNISSAMKPLLDGLICAFHGGRDIEKQEELAIKLGCEEQRLDNFRLNLLGKRDYVSFYRDNIKWNPADHLCQSVCITVVEGASWKLAGSLYNVNN